jgi:DNA-binding CsgD family transcriptional regulator
MLALLGADLAVQDVTLGVVAAVLVVGSWLYLGRVAGLIIVVLAVASRAAATLFGDISAGMAAIESAAYVAVAVLMAIPSRRTVPRPAPPLPQGLGGPPPHEKPFALAPASTASGSSLTRREREVVAMATRGMSAARIAERLFISRRTVESHLAHAYDKLEVHSKQDLIAWALAATPADIAE